jgi:hypothetical protein
MDAIERGEKSSGGKFRQLPCRTYIASGFCPYKDRCVYLHCPSIRAPYEVRHKSLLFNLLFSCLITKLVVLKALTPLPSLSKAVKRMGFRMSMITFAVTDLIGDECELLQHSATNFHPPLGFHF